LQQAFICPHRWLSGSNTLPDCSGDEEGGYANS